MKIIRVPFKEAYITPSLKLLTITLALGIFSFIFFVLLGGQLTLGKNDLFIGGISSGLTIVVLLSGLIYVSNRIFFLPKNGKLSVSIVYEKEYFYIDVNLVDQKNYSLPSGEIDFEAMGRAYVTRRGYRKLEETKWEEIEDAQFENGYQSLVIKLKGNEVIRIENTAICWLDFLYHLALLDLPNFDVLYTKQLFGTLESCEICGTIAVIEEEDVEKYCMNCMNDVWADDWLDEEYESKEDYLMEEQITYFIDFESNETIDFYEQRSRFKIDPNWQPIVTKEKLKKHS